MTFNARNRFRISRSIHLLVLLVVLALAASSCSSTTDSDDTVAGSTQSDDSEKNSDSATLERTAEGYPDSPITFRLPKPGSGTEALGRAFANAGLSEVSPVVIKVSPKPSAGTNDALFSVLQNPVVKNGYMIGLITNSSVVSTATGGAAFAFEDFQGVATIAEVPIGFVVRADSPWEKFEDFVEAAKLDASKIRLGLTGTPGSLIHIAALQMAEAIDANGGFAIVPLKTSGEAVLDLLGGGVDILTGAASGFVENVKAGKLRVLATTGSERMGNLADSPTMTELGYDVVIVNPMQIVTSSQVPMEQIQWLSDLFSAAFKVSAATDAITQTGWTPVFKDASATQASMRATYDSAFALAKDLGLIDP